MDEDEAPVWSGARRVSLNEREAKQLSHTTVKSMKEEEEEVKPHPDGPAGPIAVERAQKLRLLAEGNVHQGAFSCALNPGGSLAAVGCLDGKFRIHKRRAGSWAYVLDLRQRGLSSTSEHVATGASWRPKQDQHTQNVVLVGSTSGALAHWHPSTNSLLGTTIYENNKARLAHFFPILSLLTEKKKKSREVWLLYETADLHAGVQVRRSELRICREGHMRAPLRCRDSAMHS